MQPMIKLLRNDEAATAVEYAVMLALILMAVIGAIGMVGGQASNMWGDIDTDMTSAFGGS